MTLLVTIAFFMAVAGCFIMLELSPFVFLEGLSGYLRPKNHSMKNRIKDSKKKKEPKGLLDEFCQHLVRIGIRTTNDYLLIFHETPPVLIL